MQRLRRNVVLKLLYVDEEAMHDLHELDIIQHLTEKASAEARQQGIQQGIQQGKQQGEKESSRKHIFEVLTLRFPSEAVLHFKPALEKIDDLQRLEALFRAAILADTPEDFQKALAENGN